MNANDISSHRGRLAQAGAAIASALRPPPVVCDPDEVVEDLAAIFRRRLAPAARMTLTLSVMRSLDPYGRDALIREAKRGMKADEVFRRVGCHHGARHG